MTKSPKEQAKHFLDIILESLNEDKAEDIVVIDMDEKSDFTHYMVVSTGRSSRHVTATANNIVDRLKKEGRTEVGVEIGKGDWALVDAHDVVVHIFREETRALYNIEKIWDVTLASRV